MSQQKNALKVKAIVLIDGTKIFFIVYLTLLKHEKQTKTVGITNPIVNLT